jgi:hypothetical protein
MSFCTEVIEEIVLKLNTNPNKLPSDSTCSEHGGQSDSSQPFPLFFHGSSTSCLQHALVCENTDSYTEPWFGTSFNGFVIPSNKFVVFKSKNTLHEVIVTGPLWIPNTTEFKHLVQYPNGATLTGNVSSVAVHDISGNWLDARLTACGDNKPLEFALQSLTNYVPQSENCDLVVTNYCDEDVNKQTDCDAPYTGPSICGCFFNQTCLDEIFEDATVEIPVVCFGRDCSSGPGYRTSSMVQGTCNAEICNETIELFGEELYNSGTTTLYCNETDYNLDPSATPTPTDDSSSGGIHLTEWEIIIIIIPSIIILAVIVYIIGKFGFHKW